MIQIGDIQIKLINDSETRGDPGGPFGLVPRALWSKYIDWDDEHLIPMAQHCLLIQTNGKNIIVDTGNGDKLTDKHRQQLRVQSEGGLLKGLAEEGLSPTDIDLVISTHLHADHCGGNTRYNPDTNEIEAVFPNAEYVVQQREYDDAMHPNERTRATYYFFNFQPLVETGQMHLLDGDTELADGVWGVVTPGHTPAHMSVRIESNGEHALFACDMSTLAVHFERLGWMTAFDVEPLITLETKRHWQKWAYDNNALVMFPHDMIRPAGRLIKNDKGRYELSPHDNPYE